MDYKTYAPLALRTARIFPTSRENLRHALLGFCTELGEFATNVKRMACYDKPLTDDMRKNMIEEGGDTMWYVPLGVLSLNLKGLPEAMPEQLGVLPDNLPDLVVFMQAMSGAVAAGMMGVDEMDKEDSDVMAQCLSGIVHAMDRAALLLGTTGDELRRLNIEKLRLRFPTNFNVEDAEARADKGGLPASES
jgi:hypothetical protein